MSLFSRDYWCGSEINSFNIHQEGAGIHIFVQNHSIWFVCFSYKNSYISFPYYDVNHWSVWKTFFYKKSVLCLSVDWIMFLHLWWAGCFLRNVFSLFCNSMTILAIIEGQFSDAIKSLQKNRKKSEAKLKENWRKIERKLKETVT